MLLLLLFFPPPPRLSLFRRHFRFGCGFWWIWVFVVLDTQMNITARAYTACIMYTIHLHIFVVLMCYVYMCNVWFSIYIYLCVITKQCSNKLCNITYRMFAHATMSESVSYSKLVRICTLTLTLTHIGKHRKYYRANTNTHTHTTISTSCNLMCTCKWSLCVEMETKILVGTMEAEERESCKDVHIDKHHISMEFATEIQQTTNRNSMSERIVDSRGSILDQCRQCRLNARQTLIQLVLSNASKHQTHKYNLSQ